MLLSAGKVSILNSTMIVTDKRQNKLSEPIVWSLLHTQNWQFSLIGRVQFIIGPVKQILKRKIVIIVSPISLNMRLCA